MADKRLTVLAALCLFLVSIFLYWDTLSFGFVFYDDDRILLRQKHLFGQQDIWAGIHSIIFFLPREEPLIVRDLSWLLDSRIFGFGNAFGHHYFNVLYHGLVVSFSFVFLLSLTRQFFPALIAAALYAVLAVHVEPVSWIMGRKDILAALFLLFLLICELKFLRSTKTSHRILFYSGTLIFAGAACLSKISAVVYPGILLLLKISFPVFEYRSNSSRIWTAVFQTLPHFALNLVLYLWYLEVLSDMRLLQKSYEFEAIDYLKILALVDPLVLLRYLKLLAFPEFLSVRYDWSGLYAELTWYQHLLAVGTLVAVLVLGVVLFRKRRDLLFFYLSFFVLMLPYANLVNFGWWYANRYVYASSLFLITPLAYVFYNNRKTLPGWLLGAIIAIVASQNLNLNQRQLSVWRDGETFWAHEINNTQTNYETLMRHTIYYLSRRSHATPVEVDHWLQKADEEVQKSLALYWTDKTARPAEYLYMSFYYQGLILKYSGRPQEEQLESFSTAYSLNPDFSKTNGALAVVHHELALKTQDPEEQRHHAETALNFYKRFFALSGSSPEKLALQDLIYKKIATSFPFLLESLEPALE